MINYCRRWSNHTSGISSSIATSNDRKNNHHYNLFKSGTYYVHNLDTINNKAIWMYTKWSILCWWVINGNGQPLRTLLLYPRKDGLCCRIVHGSNGRRIGPLWSNPASSRRMLPYWVQMWWVLKESYIFIQFNEDNSIKHKIIFI